MNFLRRMGSVSTILLILLALCGVNAVSAESATPVAPEGEFSASAANILTISTSDGGVIPAGTQILIMGGSGFPAGVAYSGTLATDQPSPYTVSDFFTTTGLVYLASVSNAAGYGDAESDIFDADTPTNVTLQRTFVPGTLTVSTSDGGMIPAGTRISVYGGNPYPAGPAYGETLAADTPSPYTVTGFVPDPAYVYMASAWDAEGYTDADSDIFDADESVNVVLQAIPAIPGTLTISTSDGGVIPAGTTITVMGGASSPIGPAYSETLVTDQASPYTVSGFVPNTDYVYMAFVENAEGYEDATSSQFNGDVSTNVELQAVPEVTTGSVNLTVTTDDGGNIPAGAIISVGGVTYTATGSETSGSVIPFAEVPAGGQAVSITNAAPYNDATSTVFVVAGESNDGSILLSQSPDTTGSILLTVNTSDGGDIPAGTTFVLGGVTFVATSGDVSTADLASGTVVPFADVPEGPQTLTVTNADPYQDYTGQVTVVAGQTTDASITLILAQEPEAPTPTPTQPSESGIPTPTAPTTQPTSPQNPVIPGRTPVPGDSQPGDGTSGGNAGNGGTTGGGSGVTALPSTGQQPAGTSESPWLLLGLVTLLAAVALGGARRMQRR